MSDFERFLDPSLVRDLRGIAGETAVRISRRRTSVGLPPIDSEEVSERAIRFIGMSDDAVNRWNSPELKASRQRELNLHPSVRQFSIDCEDGRIGRAKKGAMSGLKTEHAHVSLMQSPSDGSWIPSDILIQSTLEDDSVMSQLILRVHNRLCAAWGLTISNPRAEVWDYVNPEQKQRIYELSRQEPALGNATFSALTSGMAIDRYYQQAHGLRRPVQIATTVIYDLYTTGVELLTPLVNYDQSGDFAGFPDPKDIKRVNTSKFVQALESYKERNPRDNIIPEPGKYKDDYFKREVFPEFATELTDMTEALCSGTVIKAGQELIAPKELLAIRKKIVDEPIDEGYTRMPQPAKEALKHKFVHAGNRHYLLKGQTHTHKHQELHGSGSSNGDNVGKFSPEYQTIRIHCPDPVNGERRMIVGSNVMDSNNIDGERPHIFYLVGRTLSEARLLFSQLVARPQIADLITVGRLFPMAVVVEENGNVSAASKHSVRLL